MEAATAPEKRNKAPAKAGKVPVIPKAKAAALLKNPNKQKGVSFGKLLFFMSIFCKIRNNAR